MGGGTFATAAGSGILLVEGGTVATGLGATGTGAALTGAGATTMTLAAPFAAAAGGVAVAGAGSYQVVNQTPGNYLPGRGSWSDNYFECFYDLYLDP